jgi:hypothetical protein
MIINSHSVGSDETDQALCEYIFNRVEKIKEILFLMPEYQAFFRDMPELLMSELYADIEHYNAEFCAKTGTVKPHKAHFVITLPEVNAGIAHLMQAMQSAIQADTPERAARRIITLNMQRISRELRAIDTFTVALQQETKRCSTLLADANHPRAKMPITSPILHALRELCHSHLYNDYLKKNLRATGAEFLRFVVKHSQEKLQPTLKTRQEQARQCIHTTLESLFLTHGKMLSSQDLQDIWLYGNKDPVIRQTTLVHMLQYCRFEYIPTDILQWFYALPQQITGVSHQFSNFHALSRLITTLNTAMHLPEQNSSQPPRFLQALRATQTRYTTHLLLQLLQTAEHQICIPLETLKQLDTGLKGALSAQLQIMDVTKCLAEAVQKTQGEHSTYRLSLLVHEGQATLTCVQQVRPAHAVRATTSPILRLPILIPRMPPPPTPPAPPSRTPRIPPIPPSQRRPYALR